MNTPEMKMLNRSAQAEMTRDPAFLAQLMASGVKDADLNSFASRFDPQKRDAGSYYDHPITGTREFMPTLPQGMTSQNGVITNAEGYLPAMQNRTLAEKAAETFAEFERRKLLYPGEVSQAGQVAKAQNDAKFANTTESYVDENETNALDLLPSQRAPPQVTMEQRNSIIQDSSRRAASSRCSSQSGIRRRREWAEIQPAS